MEHTEVRRRLSAYLENAVNAGEKEEIRRHLEGCASCRVTLAKLELSVGRPKGIAGAGPPSWLTEKIAAKQRAAARMEPGERRHLSVRWQLPLGAFVLVLLFVAGSYLVRTNTAREVPPNAPSEEPRSSVAAPQRSSGRETPVPEAAVPLPSALPEMPAAPARRRSAPPLPHAPAPALPGRSLSEPGLQPADEGTSAERAAEPAEWENAPREKEAEKAEVVLGVTDPDGASTAIEQAVGRLGGTIVGHASGGGSHFLAAQIEAPRLSELTGRLGRIGTLRERPQLPAGSGGMVDLIIRW